MRSTSAAGRRVTSTSGRRKKTKGNVRKPQANSKTSKSFSPKSSGKKKSRRKGQMASDLSTAGCTTYSSGMSPVVQNFAAIQHAAPIPVPESRPPPLATFASISNIRSWNIRETSSLKNRGVTKHPSPTPPVLASPITAAAPPSILPPAVASPVAAVATPPVLAPPITAAAPPSILPPAVASPVAAVASCRQSSSSPPDPEEETKRTAFDSFFSYEHLGGSEHLSGSYKPGSYKPVIKPNDALDPIREDRAFRRVPDVPPVVSESTVSASKVAKPTKTGRFSSFSPKTLPNPDSFFGLPEMSSHEKTTARALVGSIEVPKETATNPKRNTFSREDRDSRVPRAGSLAKPARMKTSFGNSKPPPTTTRQVIPVWKKPPAKVFQMPAFEFIENVETDQNVTQTSADQGETETSTEQEKPPDVPVLYTGKPKEDSPGWRQKAGAFQNGSSMNSLDNLPYYLRAARQSSPSVFVHPVDNTPQPDLLAFASLEQPPMTDLFERADDLPPYLARHSGPFFRASPAMLPLNVPATEEPTGFYMTSTSLPAFLVSETQSFKPAAPVQPLWEALESNESFSFSSTPVFLVRH